MQEASLVLIKTSVHDFAEHLDASALYPQFFPEVSKKDWQEEAFSLSKDPIGV